MNTWTDTQTRREPALCVAARQHRLQATAQVRMAELLRSDELELDRDAGRCRG